MLIAVVLVGIVVACLSYIGTGGIYAGLGRTGMSLDEPDLRNPPGFRTSMVPTSTTAISTVPNSTPVG